MSVAPGCKVLTPEGPIDVDKLRPGMRVVSYRKDGLVSNTVADVKADFVRNTKLVRAGDKTLLASTDCQPYRSAFEVGAQVRITEGAHVYSEPVSMVEYQHMTSTVHFRNIELAAQPYNVVIDSFIVSLR